METGMHPFERSGLGLAPFRYVGMVAQDIEYGRRRLNSRDEAISITTAPGGTCDHCGTYIVDMFRIRSADGREFKVGCDCLMKVSAVATVGGNVKLTADMVKLRRQKAEAKKAREADRIAAAVARLEEARPGLLAIPHPQSYRAARGETMADHVDWMMANAGHTGRLAMARLVEKHLPPA
jgi:hypothetical protein